MRKFSYFLEILLFQYRVPFAQTRQIFGKVPDAKDIPPLSGVTVSAKGAKGSKTTAGA